MRVITVFQNFDDPAFCIFESHLAADFTTVLVKHQLLPSRLLWTASLCPSKTWRRSVVSPQIPPTHWQHRAGDIGRIV